MPHEAGKRRARVLNLTISQSSCFKSHHWATCNKAVADKTYISIHVLERMRRVVDEASSIYLLKPLSP